LNTIIENLLRAIKEAENLKHVDSLYHEFVGQLCEKILALEQNEEWFSKLIHYDRGIDDRIETWTFLQESALLPKEIRFVGQANPKGDRFARIRNIWNDNKNKIMRTLHPSAFYERNREVSNE
jgi:hypothetical protein